jgi:sugar phosphate permease
VSPITRRHIFWTLFGGYAAYYLCRVNLSIAQPELEKALDASKAEVGAIASFFYLFYAVGKLTSGLMADFFGGRVLFSLGALGSAAANFAFPLADSLVAMTVIWSLNALFQSMGWAALLSIVSRWYGPTEQGTVMGFLSVNYQLGNAVAWGVMGLLSLALPWSGLFWLPAAGFAAIGVACYFFLRNDPREVGLESPHPDLHAVPLGANREHAALTTRLLVRRVLLNPYLWGVCAVSFILTFIRYTFITWAPTYLLERGSELSVSAFQAALFPLVGSAGSILAGWYSDRFSASRRAPIMAALCLGLAATLVGFGFAQDAPIAVAGVLLAVAGFTLYGPYSLLSGAIAIDLGSRHAAATAGGIIDGVGYVGAALSGSGMGWLIDALGWEASFLVLAGAAGVCVVVAFFAWRVRPAAVAES